MTQLFFSLTIFFFGLSNQRIIDESHNELFTINGENYLIGPFNEVYRIKGEEIIQIDKSLDSRISIDSYKLLINDTIVKFGGYGFWSQRNFMYYFDFSTLEWEYFKTKTNSLVDGSFLGNFNQNKEKVIFYGGLKTDPLNRIKKIKSFEIVQYDFKSRTLDRIGDLEFVEIPNQVFYKSSDYTLYYDDEYIYKINPFINKVEKYIKPKSLSFVKEVVYDEKHQLFIVKKVSSKNNETIEINFDLSFLNNPLETFNLYKTSKNNLLWVSMLLVFIVLLYLIRKISEKSKVYFEGVNLFKYGVEYEFEASDIQIIKSLLKLNEMSFNNVMEVYSNSELSYGHNTRISNERLDRLSVRLKTIFKLKNHPIKKIKSKEDRRQKVVILTKEFQKINIIFK